MSIRTKPHAGVYIGKLRLRGRVLRDLIHGGGLPVHIEEIDVDADIGGDALNVAPPKPKRETKPRKRPTSRVRRAITAGAAAIGSIAGMVTATGISNAFGWGG